MKIQFAIIMLFFITMGCGSTGEQSSDMSESSPSTTSTPAESEPESHQSSSMAAAEATPAPTGTVAFHSVIPYAENNRIAANIKKECNLPTKLSDFIKAYAQDYNVSVEQKPSVSSSDPGSVLMVEIVESVSQGNAFLGHRKYTEIEGKLYQDGAMVASFRAARNSGGGAFGGWKGSCAVLGRTVKALGKDVARWLKAPVQNASLGDM